MTDLAAIVDALAEKFLGRHGIVSISDGDDAGRMVVIVFVSGALEDATSALPKTVEGVPVIVRQSGQIVLH